MIAVGGLDDETVETLAAITGRDVPDLLDEHTSWIWFHDRTSWRASWRMARQLAKGRRVKVQCGVAPRELLQLDDGVIIDIAVHHTTEAA